jgi:hypothetical protein
MKLAWTILITALIFWLMQIFLFLLLLAASVVHIFLSVLLVFGVSIPDSKVQDLISKILTILISPLNIIATTPISKSLFTTILLLS